MRNQGQLVRAINYSDLGLGKTPASLHDSPAHDDHTDDEDDQVIRIGIKMLDGKLGYNEIKQSDDFKQSGNFAVRVCDSD